MYVPSKEKMIKDLNLNKNDALILQLLMKEKQINETFNLANYLLKGNGVKTLNEYPNFQYIDLGDSKKPTLCFTGNIFIVHSWEQWIEDIKQIDNL
jgi:hypothetical protein